MAKHPKQKHRKGRRKCAFCGGFRISREHVFPDWLKEYFPRDDKTTHTMASFVWPENIITKVPIEKRRPGQGHVGVQKVKVVCEKCNSGWMSALEESMKPILIPLITGEQTNLPFDIQFKLATWATKTSMVAEHLRPRKNGISQEERTWLMENLIPPANWFVWVGAYNDEIWRNLSIFQNRGRLDSSPVSRPSKARYYVQSTTFGMGHILFLTVSTSMTQITGHLVGRETDGFFQIWPPQPRSILWPPARILADPQANAVANFLNLTNLFDRSLDPSADWTFTF